MCPDGEGAISDASTAVQLSPSSQLTKSGAAVVVDDRQTISRVTLPGKYGDERPT